MQAVLRVSSRSVVPVANARGMAVSAKALKLRLKTVSNIKRITSTMKMVSASKLKGFQSRMDASRPLSEAVNHTFDSLPSETAGDAAAAPSAAAASTLLPLYFGVCSDRGLCGAINSAVVKAIRKASHDHKNQMQICLVGDKGRNALGRTHAKMMRFTVNDAFKKPPTFLTASLLAESALAEEFSQFFLVFNRFKSAIAYDTLTKDLGTPAELMAKLPKIGETYEFEGDEKNIMGDLIQFRYAVALFSSLLENATCEQSARMAAMDGASKNCGEMISKLTTQMNRARQAIITTELCEIVAGAEAISN